MTLLRTMAGGILFFAALMTRALAAQTPTGRHEIVQGRVVGDSARPLPNATVIATRISDRQFKSTNTDSAGRFSIDWPDGTGEYVIYASASGVAPANRHVILSAGDSIIVADFTLTRSAQNLSAVVVTAQRADRARDAALRTDVGASEVTTVPQNAARRLSPDQAGDLSAIAALGTGITPVAGGISVLGLGAGQNAVTLNGLAFGSSDVPRDAATRVRVTSSSYDPSIGWFSGARTQVDLLPGDLFTTRNGHLTVDAPAAQWTDPISAQLGQRYTNFNASMGGTGQLVDDEWSYNYGMQGGRKSSDYASLLTAGTDLLQHVGVSSDSAVKLAALLQTAGVPFGASGAPLSRLDDNFSFIGRIDHAPYDWKTLQAAKTTWGLTGYAKWARTQGLGLGPTSTLGHAGQSSLGIGSLAGEWSSFFARDYLADVRSSFSYTRNSTMPDLNLPSGSVLIQSIFPDGTGGVSAVQFGGNSGLRTTARNWTWESIGDVQLFPPGAATHKVRLTGDVRLDGAAQDVATNSLGSYSFNSLAALAANQPAAFTRALNSPTRSGSVWNAFAAVKDLWRVNQNLLVNYGLRAEGNVFESPPAFNPAVAAAFGVRTDHAPNTVALSPRLGFNYNVPGAGGRPTGTVRGGVGEFRNLIDPSLLLGPSVATGLPNGAGQLTCFGAAVPLPSWTQFAADASSIPTQCANGAGASFSDAAPVVRLMAPDFTAVRSWRGNLAWSATAFRSAYTIEGTISQNLNQRGTRDLNFSGISRFTTSDESRPVFANPGSIVPATGGVSPVDARQSSAFGSVYEGVTDLRSQSRQLAFTVRPFLGKKISPYVGDMILGYTLASVRDQQRGFDQATFGDPRSLDWARGQLDARHQFWFQGVVRPHTGFILFYSGHVLSGTPYTPMIRTDVNGDGLANDRAFVFDPAKTADPLLAGGVRDLLAHTSSGARDCLLRQLGTAAARASCQGPWSASLNTSLRISGEQVFHQPRMDVTIGISNPLGGLDQLLHGSANLRGWGTTPAPDPVLLDVQRFDAANRRFVYSVNPRFGTTSAAFNTIRAPFRLTLDVSFDLAAPQTKQQMSRWLGPNKSSGKAMSVTAPELMQRFKRTVPDPYSELIQQADSLLLTEPQVEALHVADSAYRVRVDSIWNGLSSYLVSLPDANAAVGAFRTTDQSTDDAWEITRVAVQRDFPKILTADQLTQLSGFGRYLFNAPTRVHIRIYPRG